MRNLDREIEQCKREFKKMMDRGLFAAMWYNRLQYLVTLKSLQREVERGYEKQFGGNEKE